MELLRSLWLLSGEFSLSLTLCGWRPLKEGAAAVSARAEICTHKEPRALIWCWSHSQ